MSNLKYPFTLLREEAVEEDLFNGETHQKIAGTLYDLITNEEKGATIGLEGPWGSGKTTVISLLKNKLKESQNNIRMFYFDAWAHEGDPLRRTFLESFRQFAEKNDDIDKIIDKISKRTTEYKTTSTSSTTALGKWLAISAFLIPLGAALVSQIDDVSFFKWDKSLHWLFIISTSIAMAPIIILLLNLAWISLNKNKRKNGIFSNANWAFLQSDKTEEVTQEISEDNERSSLEFEKYFNDIMEILFTKISGPKLKKLVIVIDNLDRIDANDSLKIWSTLQTFLQERNNLSDHKKPWFDNIWVIVPYDSEGLAKLWDKNKDLALCISESQGIYHMKGIRKIKNNKASSSFFDKCFQVKLDVPKPIPTSWKDFAKRKIKEALVDWPKKEADAVLEVLEFTRTSLTDIPTPRQIKNYINQAAILKYHREEISTESIAFYVVQRVLENKTVDNIRKGLVSGDLLKENNGYLLPADSDKEIAGIIFGVSPDKGIQMLLKDSIYDAVIGQKDNGLIELEKKYGDSFWAAFLPHLHSINPDPQTSTYEWFLKYTHKTYDAFWKTGRDMSDFLRWFNSIIHGKIKLGWPNSEMVEYFEGLTSILKFNNETDLLESIYKNILDDMQEKIKSSSFKVSEYLTTLKELSKMFGIQKQYKINFSGQFKEWANGAITSNTPAWKWVYPNNKPILDDEFDLRIKKTKSDFDNFKNEKPPKFNNNSNELHKDILSLYYSTQVFLYLVRANSENNEYVSLKLKKIRSLNSCIKHEILNKETQDELKNIIKNITEIDGNLQNHKE